VVKKIKAFTVTVEEKLEQVKHFFLFQPNAPNKLNTYIYHQLPPTCFSVCYTIFRENNELLAQKLYAFWNVAIQYTMFFRFTMLLQRLKQYVFCPSVT